MHPHQHFIVTGLAHRRFHQLQCRWTVTALLQLVLALGVWASAFKANTMSEIQLAWRTNAYM
jgi:hypothetical protein